MSNTADLTEEIAAIRRALQHSPERASLRMFALASKVDRPEHVMAVAKLATDLSTLDHSQRQLRIAILGDLTMNAIGAASAVAAARERIVANVYVAPFGALSQEILDPASGIYAFRPDIVLLFPELTAEGGAEASRVVVSETVETWQSNWAILSARLPSVRIVHHLSAIPEDELAGPAEANTGWTPTSLLRTINDAMSSAAPASVHLLDLDRLAARVGRLSWYDPRLRHHAKLPFALKHLSDYVSALGGALRRSLGTTRKALVVDLDNTLWGGVIGDDGLDGIRLGPGDPVGEAFSEFCKYLQALGRRGVILGICSKNDLETAMAVFDVHPGMPLTRDNFVAVRCNWQDKASNLRSIADELNIDLSALVFVDDNPAECDFVRRELPQVAVVELAGDPSGHRRTLDSLRFFEADRLSSEDLNRAHSYRARKAAETLRTSASSLDDYLGSLSMQGDVWLARQADILRLSQMEAKTNQFNLTTRRWSSEQLGSFVASQAHDVICLRLADRFADHGLISGLVVEYSGTEAIILSWLMSCRVFSRTAEEFLLNSLVQISRARGATEIVGHYVASPKNSVVADLYPRLGFASTGPGRYRLVISDATERRTFIARASP